MQFSSTFDAGKAQKGQVGDGTFGESLPCRSCPSGASEQESPSKGASAKDFTAKKFDIVRNSLLSAMMDAFYFRVLRVDSSGGFCHFDAETVTAGWQNSLNTSTRCCAI